MLLPRKDFQQRIANGTGLSLTKFCKAQGLNRSTIAFWIAGTKAPEPEMVVRVTTAYVAAAKAFDPEANISRLDAQDHLFREVPEEERPRNRSQSARRRREADERATRSAAL